MTTDASTADLGYVTVTRDFDAPRELVFGAFTDPQQLARFWGPTGTHVPPESVVIEPVPSPRMAPRQQCRLRQRQAHRATGDVVQPQRDARRPGQIERE